jgi:AcrR family transcriptional regulator
MAKRSIDRRVVRTTKTLHQALISLILKKNYEAITIQEICDEANIGRSTFYAHYTSKDELHQRGIEHLRKLLADGRSDATVDQRDIRGRSLSFSRALFQHAQDRKDLFQALAGSRGGAVALATIRRVISDAVRDGLAETVDKNSTDSIPRELIVQFVVGAYMAVLTWWLDQGAKLPPAKIDAMFRRLAGEGLESLYSRSAQVRSGFAREKIVPCTADYHRKSHRR